MSFNWSNYLIIAKEACERANGADPGKEAKYRSAISRAYYGALCSARNYLMKHKITLRNDESLHAQIINEFSNNKNKTWQQIGLNLDRLRKSRVKADYHNEYCVNKRPCRNLASEVIISISHSEGIIANLNRLDSTDTTETNVN